MFILISALMAITLGSGAMSVTLITFMVMTQNLLSYQVVGGSVAALATLAVAAWFAYLALWSLSHKEEALRTIREI